MRINPILVLLPAILLMITQYSKGNQHTMLRDVSYVYGFDLDRQDQTDFVLYSDTLWCKPKNTCGVTPPTQYVLMSVCIAIGDTTSAFVYGMICPPLDYTLEFNSTPPAALDIYKNQNSTTTTITTNIPSSARKEILISTAEEEKEILGLFSFITPHSAYVVKYVNYKSAKCSFHKSSAGHIKDLISGPVCYDAKKRGLMLLSEYPTGTNACLDFYSIKYNNHYFGLGFNKTLMDEDQTRGDGTQSSNWTYTNTHACDRLTGVDLSSQSLRDISYAYGIDHSRQNPTGVSLYKKWKKCTLGSQCTNGTTMDPSTPICILTGDSKNKFNGVICPPSNYDLRYERINGFPNITITHNPGTPLIVSGIRTTLVIHNKREEEEIIALFDAITPKQVYLIKYDSFTPSCSFHSSSRASGQYWNAAIGGTVCYDASKGGLMLRSEYPAGKCLEFYSISSAYMDTYDVVYNETLVDEDRARNDGIDSFQWSLNATNNKCLHNGPQTTKVITTEYAITIIPSRMIYNKAGSGTFATISTILISIMVFLLC